VVFYICDAQHVKQIYAQCESINFLLLVRKS